VGQQSDSIDRLSWSSTLTRKKDFVGQTDCDQQITQLSSKVGTHMAAMARRPVGACKIMITQVKFIEKMQLLQISPS